MRAPKIRTRLPSGSDGYYLCVEVCDWGASIPDGLNSVDTLGSRWPPPLLRLNLFIDIEMPSVYRGYTVNQRPIEIVTFTTLFPNAIAPNHGVFVENRLQHLVRGGQVSSSWLLRCHGFHSARNGLGGMAEWLPLPNQEDRMGLHIMHPRFALLPKVGMSSAPSLLFAACLPLMRRLRQERDFDLIDAHYFYPDGVAAVLLGKVLGKPVVITARGSDVNALPNYIIPRIQIRWAAVRAARVVAVSEALKEALVGMAIEPNHVEVLRNGVDLDIFFPRDRVAARRRFGLERPTLLSVGQLIERKSNDLVFGALRLLPDHVLLVAGDGPERDRLRSLAEQLGVSDRIRFLGSIPHRQLAELYSAADALVLASSREGWPNVLLESMACGTPVVASNIWGNPEVVRGPEAGFLMEERNSEGIAAAVRRLFANLPDRSATRRYAEKFSWDKTSVGQINLFEKVVADHLAGTKLKANLG